MAPLGAEDEPAHENVFNEAHLSHAFELWLTSNPAHPENWISRHNDQLANDRHDYLIPRLTGLNPARSVANKAFWSQIVEDVRWPDASERVDLSGQTSCPTVRESDDRLNRITAGCANTVRALHGTPQHRATAERKIRDQQQQRRYRLPADPCWRR